MKTKVYIFVVLVLPLFLVSPAIEVHADSAESREYEIKAAFLYNFARFVNWPEKKVNDSTEPMTFGIIGKDPFGDAFAPLKSKRIRGRSIIIKRFEGGGEFKESGGKSKSEPGLKIKALRKCDLLFICSSEQKNLGRIIGLVKNHDVLTVGDMKGFLEAGGIINFLMEDKKVRFEINVTTAEHAKLKIRSKLLKLARRVIEEETSNEAES
ncbi:MAG: YfiR family protein [Planctomycetota bacterium]|jgi:hypothetical protein